MVKMFLTDGGKDSNGVKREIEGMRFRSNIGVSSSSYKIEARGTKEILKFPTVAVYVDFIR